MSQSQSPGSSSGSRTRSPAGNRSFLNEGISSDATFPESPEYEYEHEYEPYDEVFKVDKEQLNELMNEQDIHHLKNWISHVFSKLIGYDYFNYELVELIRQNDPGSFITTSERPSVIVTGIKKIIRTLNDSFIKFDIGVGEISTLTGSRLGARIAAEAKKASKVLEHVEKENIIISDTLKQAGFKIESLEEKLEDALNYIDILKEEDIFRKIHTKERYFLEELKYRRSEKDNLESSLLGDLALINKELEYNSRKLLEEKQEKMDLLAEMQKDLELEDGIRTALLEKINTLNKDEDICKEALNEWMKAIAHTVEEKKPEIEKMKDMMKTVDDEIEYLKQEFDAINKERNELDDKITLCNHAVEEKYKEIEEFDEEIAMMKEHIRELEQEYLALSNEAQKRKQDMNSLGVMDRSYRSPTPSGSPGSVDRSGSSYAESMGSPKFQQAVYSPKYMERATSPIYPPSSGSPEEMPPSSRNIPYIVVTPPPSEYPANAGFRQDVQPMVPEAQTISNFQSNVAPVNPSTQSMVRNRFDIGQNFNMQTVHSGIPSPYQQVTRLQTSSPATGTSRMIDSPVQLQHAAQFTPPQFVTPYVSTTRYGYTDPTAKCLNLPPGDDIDVGSSLRKTLLLTSPRRENPLIVNIDVQPQPLAETVDGEQFVCDISLNLKDTNTPPIEPTYTYGVPPSVTPTSARRHGQFTPRSIFKKRHYNIRRLFGPQYKSPDMPSKWSPHYLPFDARSPLSSFQPSPYYSDRSISWERDYDDTFDESMMNRTFDTFSGTSEMNRTYNPQSGTSAMNRTYKGPGTSTMNKRFDRSPSPVIKPPTRRYPSPVFSDEPYDIETASPVIKGPSHRSPMYGQSSLSESPFSESDKSFGSPSPVIKSRFYRGSSHDRTFDSNQSSPRTNFDRSSTRHSFLDRSSSPGSYEKSFSPRSDKSFNQSLSPKRDGPLDRSISSRSDKSFNQSVSPRRDETFDRSFSPRSDKSFNQSLSPRQEGTYGTRFSPRSDKSFNQSLSPKRDGPLDRSISSRSDKSFNQSVSPRQNVTFDTSSTPRSDKSFNQSLSPERDGRLDRSFSSRSDKSFNQSMSPNRDGTFDGSFSSRSDKSFNQSMSPGSTGTFDSSSSRLDETSERFPKQTADIPRGLTRSSILNKTINNVSLKGIDESSIRDSRNQYLNVPNQDSPKQNRTFASTSSNQGEDMD